ncbi:Serine/threonine protein kinase [Prosthecobacter debontii]|uniref:non-specific serine/threonine protein kinase n=1 Tax=Prosthecobacter debontii TaxID=48467 RepID=A0A1T4YGY4_9BACT|nr:protein kinase [Prosthecobacter debontii]SKB00920.1 Serine/threonine protein kinase [Prosthecobacter debontii]
MSLPDIAGHELQELIGSGACGAVYRASAGGKSCAVKVFSSMAINRKALATALGALQQMPHHQAVLPVENYNFERSPYYLVTPLVGMMVKEGQSRRWQTTTLETLCAKPNSDLAWGCIYQMADALAWLHRHGIPHGNLRPCNILMEDDASASIRITDMAQGWVGGIHHLELTDHFVHLCPEQAENPEGVFAGYGASWDVYSFGVIAYRLLTGQFPRGARAWAEQLALAQKKSASGLAYGIDSMALVNAVRAQPKIVWPDAPTSKWDERRRNIIERALDLNAAARWADMREVVREFEVLESDFLLEESREQTVFERKKQAVKVRTLQVTALGLLTVLVLTAIYAFITLRGKQKAEVVIAQNEEVLQREIKAREEKISTLTSQRDTSIAQKKTADANLQHSQTAVDQFLTQLLQSPTSNELDTQFAKGQLRDALAFCMTALPALESDPELGVERLRAYGNIGQIHLRMRDYDSAQTYLEKARDQAALLLKDGKNHPKLALFHQWFGKYSLLLSDLATRKGDKERALALLGDATTSLTEGLAADPKNRLARNECARAWMEYGLRMQKNGNLADAEKALAHVSDVLDPKLIGTEFIPEERFLLARSKFAKGLTQRDAGRLQDALTTLIDAVTEMGDLVMGSSPRNQEQALMLADAYTELAELISKSIGAKEAREAHMQAIPILLELNRLLPEWAEVKYQLAKNYGGVSLLERDAGNNNDAVKKKQDAIELLNEILADEPDNLRYGYLLSKLRGEYAELMSDLNKPTAALPIIQQAVTSMEELLTKEPDERLTPDRKAHEIQLAQMYGVLGHTSESLKKKDEARNAFSFAVKRWEKLAALVPGDDIIQQGLTWAKDRLAKLK